jgi:hypothetical protein
MKTKHTKGEWKVDSTSKICNYDCVTSEMAYQVKTDDWDIAAVWKDAEGDCEANAKLIAAAPELLKALNKMNVALTGHDIEPDQEDAFESMRIAIKKATE